LVYKSKQLQNLTKKAQQKAKTENIKMMGKHPLTLIKTSLNTAKMVCLVLITSALLSGCAFKPLYGPTASNQELTTVLAGIDIPEVPGRVGQQVRNELIFRFTGGGHANAPQYKLVLAVKERVTSQLVERDGDSLGQIYQLTTNFKLYSITDGKNPLLTGKSYSKASFLDDDSVYANVRSRRDAENRTAKVTADDIQGRIAAFLSSNS